MPETFTPQPYPMWAVKVAYDADDNLHAVDTGLVIGWMAGPIDHAGHGAPTVAPVVLSVGNRLPATLWSAVHSQTAGLIEVDIHTDRDEANESYSEVRQLLIERKRLARQATV